MVPFEKAIDADGIEVGVVTGGCPSFTLDENIAVGYIKVGLHKVGTDVDVDSVMPGKPSEAVASKVSPYQHLHLTYKGGNSIPIIPLWLGFGDCTNIPLSRA
ncbi:hypothetical protein K449DRAFT_394484 [Hypoxylon sp. EC38]|nr:hypothetical protein K449DRAFT_394484 [Hypoxylon sp. EC38]